MKILIVLKLALISMTGFAGEGTVMDDKKDKEEVREHCQSKKKGHGGN